MITRMTERIFCCSEPHIKPIYFIAELLTYLPMLCSGCLELIAKNCR